MNDPLTLIFLLALLLLAMWVVVRILFLPTFIAKRRRHPHAFSVFLVNLFFGWTLVGWFVALVWACSAPEVRRA